MHIKNINERKIKKYLGKLFFKIPKCYLFKSIKYIFYRISTKLITCFIIKKRYLLLSINNHEEFTTYHEG